MPPVTMNWPPAPQTKHPSVFCSSIKNLISNFFVAVIVFCRCCCCHHCGDGQRCRRWRRCCCCRHCRFEAAASSLGEKKSPDQDFSFFPTSVRLEKKSQRVKLLQKFNEENELYTSWYFSLEKFRSRRLDSLRRSSCWTTQTRSKLKNFLQKRRLEIFWKQRNLAGIEPSAWGAFRPTVPLSWTLEE